MVRKLTLLVLLLCLSGVTHARYVTSDPIGLEGGKNTYNYAEMNPLMYFDPLGLYTEVIIWQPVGFGSSSFGHVSSNVNGRNYSFGPGGWDTNPSAEVYAQKNSFRSGVGNILNLTPEQERRLERCYARQSNAYSALHNNCSDPHQSCLSDVLGYTFTNSLFPVSFGNDLIDSPYYNGSKFYPSDKKRNPFKNAPWTK